MKAKPKAKRVVFKAADQMARPDLKPLNHDERSIILAAVQSIEKLKRQRRRAEKG